MSVINTLEDKNSVESVEEEKDERYYHREKKALEKVAVINNLILYINEAQSMQQQARIVVGQAKEDTYNKVPIEPMYVAVIVDFYQNFQLPSRKKDQPGETYFFFVPPKIYVLGVVDCNSLKDHLHAYMYPEAEIGKGGSTVDAHES